MAQKYVDSFGTRKALTVASQSYDIFRLDLLEKSGLKNVSKLPVSLKVLLENLLRQEDNHHVNKGDIEALATWSPKAKQDKEIAFMPARVLMQDLTGVPAVVDLAAMREAMKRLGGDPKKINPLAPVDLVIDHSVQVDYFGTPEAFHKNSQIEFERNVERYAFLRWGQKAFVWPPGLLNLGSELTGTGRLRASPTAEARWTHGPGRHPSPVHADQCEEADDPGECGEATGVGERAAGPIVATRKPPAANAPSSAEFRIPLYAANALPCRSSGTRTWMRLRNMTFLRPCATPPTNEQARKKAKLSHSAGRPSPDPWTATAANPVAATAAGATRGESRSAPRAIPTVQIESINP